jgi:branched-chain amino acid transport system ATP-binding protein
LTLIWEKGEAMLLDIKDITVHYGAVQAIRGVSLRVDEGTVTSVVGANGAGKSTILKTVSGLLHPSSGEIWFKGQRIDLDTPARVVRAGIAHVPEGRRLFAHMTVLENLRAGAYLRRDGDRVVTDLDRMFDYFPILKERHTQKAGTLSGGEQQMLAIARALMSAPQLILMDEPSLGLAPMLIAEIGRIVSDLHRDGMTILLVEQNVRLALEAADKLYVMETGTVVLEGAPADLRETDEIKRAYLGG